MATNIDFLPSLPKTHYSFPIEIGTSISTNNEALIQIARICGALSIGLKQCTSGYASKILNFFNIAKYVREEYGVDVHIGINISPWYSVWGYDPPSVYSPDPPKIYPWVKYLWEHGYSEEEPSGGINPYWEAHINSLKSHYEYLRDEILQGDMSLFGMIDHVLFDQERWVKVGAAYGSEVDPEIKKISMEGESSPDGGTYSIKIGEIETGDIPYNSNQEEIQSFLNDSFGEGEILIICEGDKWDCNSNIYIKGGGTLDRQELEVEVFTLSLTGDSFPYENNITSATVRTVPYSDDDLIESVNQLHEQAQFYLGENVKISWYGRGIGIYWTGEESLPPYTPNSYSYHYINRGWTQDPREKIDYLTMAFYSNAYIDSILERYKQIKTLHCELGHTHPYVLEEGGDIIKPLMPWIALGTSGRSEIFPTKSTYVYDYDSYNSYLLGKYINYEWSDVPFASFWPSPYGSVASPWETPTWEKHFIEYVRGAQDGVDGREYLREKTYLNKTNEKDIYKYRIKTEDEDNPSSGNIQSLVIDNVEFDVGGKDGKFTWDIGGENEYSFSSIDEQISVQTDNLYFLVKYKGEGSYLFDIEFSEESHIYKTIADLINDYQKNGESIDIHMEDILETINLLDMSDTNGLKINLYNQFFQHKIDFYNKTIKYTSEILNLVRKLQENVLRDYDSVDDFLEQNSLTVKSIFADISEDAGYLISDQYIRDDISNG